jgi:4-hydroxythreonine-4-phosphate dehydrogenase
VIRLGVTIGDPAGIGPEIVEQALQKPLAGASVRVFGERGSAQPGRPSRETGRAQVEFLEAAIAAVKAGEIDALCTAPISKSAAQAAGFAFPGHTEFLAARFGVSRFAMMLAGPRLRVSLVTTHLALADVASALTPDRISDTVCLTAESLHRDFGIHLPRIAVAALNPHAGESGAFGHEELDIITPGITEAAGCGALVTGPHVPDAVFRQAAVGAFDAVVCMYHDQGLIPLKLLDFEDAVNLTLGLPIVRTSPDHGVAYDIAGTGRARATSMRRALELAAELCARRLENQVR